MDENNKHSHVKEQSALWGSNAAGEAFETLGQGVIILEVDGRIEYANAAFAQMVARSPEELVGLTITDVAHPDDRLRISNHFARLQAAAKDDAHEIDFRIRHGDSSWRWLRTQNAIFKQAADGQEQQFLCAATDITDLKQAEESLKEGQALQSGIIGSAMDAIITVDSSHQIVFFNTAAENMFGAYATEVIGQPIDRFIPERFRTIHRRHIERFGQTGATNREMGHLDPLLALRADGREFPIEATISRAKSSGQTLYTVIIRDITERMQVEEALRESKTQLQYIIDTVPEGVILLDADEIVRLTNPVAERFLAILAPGWEDGRLTRLGDRPVRELLTSPPKGLWHELNQDNYAFETIAQPVEISVANTGWVLIVRDVTQEREIQRRAQQQERLAAVGQLAAGIAHDFNNVMAVITLYADVVSRTAELPSNAQKKLNIIEQQAQRAAELIQQILDFSRQSVLERRLLDLLPFMKELVKLLERTLPEHIRIEQTFDDDSFMIQADPSRIQQLMMNLAVNARDAMPDGGRMSISVSHRETENPIPLFIRTMPAGSWIQIQVSDTGSGIHPKSVPHIFEPFFTTKDGSEGTGLGLAQVYGIVQQHEGYIDVSTKAGQGTTFTLYFPAVLTGERFATTPERLQLEKGQGQLVLVVEDDPDTRQALIDSLFLLNYRVIEATNGRKALDVLTANNDEISAVLSDVVMPDMGGIGLFRAMQERKHNIPTIFLTGHPLNKEIENILALGLAGWLSKPPDLVSLSNILAKVLSS